MENFQQDTRTRVLNQTDRHHHRVLIANNGMSALKFCLSMKHRSDLWIVGISNSSIETDNYEYLDNVHQIIGSDQETVFMNPEEIIRCAVQRAFSRDGVSV